MAIEGILFDCDGVIIDTDRTYRQLVTKILSEKYGYNIELEEAIIRWNGKNANQIATELAFEGCDFADDFVYSVHEASRNYVIDESIIVDNLVNILEKYKSIPKGICSNGRHDRISRNLEQVGLLKYFDFVQGRDNSGLMKPDPQVFIQGAETLGLDIKKCLIVEDSALGLEAAVKSGGIAVGFIGTGTKREDLEIIKPHYIISNLSELENIINSKKQDK